ncbi:MAG: hypothetical protein E6J17_06925 [Chloroflexi bacterium]|nr:MAG: hypothetical protein E6J17_06925 [Chloroflexota bacterium]
MGEQVLVRRHDRLAGGERRRDKGASRLLAADQLDDDVDPRVRDDVGGSVGQQVSRQSARPGAIDVPNRDRRELEWRPAVGREPLAEPQQAERYLAPDGPRAEQADTQRRAAHASRT